MDIVIIDGLSFALPLFIMAIGGIYCEKSGVTMLAVEGLQGFGAFIGAFVAVAIAGNFSGDSPVPFYIAMIMAAVGGSIFALIHALLCLKFKANQVISGVVVNILAMALTAYLTKLLNRVVFGATSDKFVLTVSSRITIPGISKIPVLGAVFTNLYPFELVIVAVAFIAWFVMYKTRFGMHLRACSGCSRKTGGTDPPGSYHDLRCVVGTWRYLLCIFYFRELFFQYLCRLRISGHRSADLR